MQVLRCSSGLGSVQKLAQAAAALCQPALLLRPSAARTEAELAFSFYLARRALESGENLSPKLPNEALLCLACETNFSSAAKKAGAKDTRDFLLACERKIPLARLKGALRLKSAKAVKLPEWGRKVGNYSEGELAVERMALARIVN